MCKTIRIYYLNHDLIERKTFNLNSELIFEIVNSLIDQVSWSQSQVWKINYVLKFVPLNVLNLESQIAFGFLNLNCCLFNINIKNICSISERLSIKVPFQGTCLTSN